MNKKNIRTVDWPNMQILQNKVIELPVGREETKQQVKQE